MNNYQTNNNSTSEDMLTEYDFSKGIRGKHHQQYKQGHKMTIHYADGTKNTTSIEPDDDMIILDADVKQYFPDSESVNSTLRSLIKLIPKKTVS